MRRLAATHARRFFRVLGLASSFAACAGSAVAARAPVLPAATGTVIGHVTRPDGPAAHASIHAVGSNKRAIAEPDGSFRLAELPPGRHVLKIASWYCESREVEVSVRAGGVEMIRIPLACEPIPCLKQDPSDPKCTVPNPEERARVGRRCEVHFRVRLRPDIVQVRHGIVGYTPGASGEERKRFPNARVWWSAGCVNDAIPWTEVAFCEACRTAYAKEKLGRGGARYGSR